MHMYIICQYYADIQICGFYLHMYIVHVHMLTVHYLTHVQQYINIRHQFLHVNIDILECLKIMIDFKVS